MSFMPTNENSVSDLAAHVGGHVIGDGKTVIRSVSSLNSAEAGEIAYVEDEKFFEAAKISQAS